MTTPKLALPELLVGQSGKELTHNQALAILSQLTQANVVDKDLTAPPASPADGSMYIPAAGSTGAWLGKNGQLAFWLTSVGAWTFAVPVNGWRVWVTDEAAHYTRKAGTWTIDTSGGVSGPASAADGNLALFDGSTGKLIKDGGIITAAGKALLDDADAAAQRTTLGLGTAATSNKQTSTTDTTAGALMAVGAFGAGAAAGTYLFGRANLLGYVSQSAGVPTGAIIERGSNANGEYVRWADGTQICMQDGISFTAASGGTTNVSGLYPAPFINNPYFLMGDGQPTVHEDVYGFSRIFSGSNQSQWSVGYRNGSSGSQTIFAVNVFAIGRWF